MHTPRLVAIAAAVLVLGAACSASKESPGPAATAGATGTAGASQTVAAPETPTPIKARFDAAFPSLPTLDRPANMIELPTHWMLVTLQDGRVVTFPNDAAASTLTVVLDLRSKVSRDGNEEGLLGVAMPPRASSADLYLYYSAKPGERRTVLSGFRLSGTGAGLRADPASEIVLLTVPQPYPNHKGGQLAFGPDAMLYLGLGDGGSAGDPNGNGQDLKKNLLASIIRIDVRESSKEKPYAVPPDNPFASATDSTKRETWAYGLRNPWRFSFDRATGRLIAGDVGQDTREEINVIEKGGNYGWNIMEGMRCYKPGQDCKTDGLTLPIVDYGHENGACSVTGGYVYRGTGSGALTGSYLYADFCNGAVWAIPAFNPDNTHPEPVQLRAKGPSVTSFAEDLAGELYLLSFDGKIYRVAAQ